MNSAPLLECQDVAFTRDDYPLFSGVTFQLFSGQTLQISGVNGAGKTTLLRILATSLSPSEGQLFWGGQPLPKSLATYRRDMLYLGHSPGVKGALTPRENLAWYFKLFPAMGSSIESALEQVGLAGYEDVPCQTLSAGQLRRVALARLYISGARLWILDEPFTSIDVNGVAQLEQLIGQHTAGGGTVILTSHQKPNLTDFSVLELETYAG